MISDGMTAWSAAERSSGLILPNAQGAGERFWSELAEPTGPRMGGQGGLSIPAPEDCRGRGSMEPRRDRAVRVLPRIGFTGRGGSALRVVDSGGGAHRPGGRAAGPEAGL